MSDFPRPKPILRAAPLLALLAAAACTPQPPVDAPPKSVLLFTNESVALDPGAQGVIDEFAHDAQANPRRRILVEGYSDLAGTQANRQLALTRAQVVADALVGHGIDRSRITLRPRPPNGTEPGLESRRVELELGN